MYCERIVKNRNAAIIGVIESKLDKSVTYSEIKSNGYGVLRSVRICNRSGVACYNREYIFL